MRAGQAPERRAQAPVSQSFVAIFPQAQSSHDEGGQWNSGHMGADAAISGADDVSFALDCVEKLNQLLSSRYAALTGHEPDPSLPTFYTNAPVLVLGLSNGGEIA